MSKHRQLLHGNEWLLITREGAFFPTIFCEREHFPTNFLAPYCSQSNLICLFGADRIYLLTVLYRSKLTINPKAYYVIRLQENICGSQIMIIKCCHLYAKLFVFFLLTSLLYFYLLLEHCQYSFFSYSIEYCRIIFNHFSKKQE